MIQQDYFPEVLNFINAVTAPATSPALAIPSRTPITFDINIQGTATVKMYLSNFAHDDGVVGAGVGATWGAAARTFTASEKVVLEGEPWKYCIFEVVSVSGTVSVVAAA